MNPHLAHKITLAEMFGSFWRNRYLILQMTKREVIGRYRGSFVGLAWSLLNPLLMLAVYTFFFSVVFKARWEGQTDNASFAILLFVGMLVHGVFAECINRAPALIVANANYVKKVVFPLEVLPWVAIGSALFHATISLFVLIVVQFILTQNMYWTAILFPITILPLILIAIGFAWFLSAIGVYLRDVAQTVGVFTTVLLFLSPVFYPITALPSKYQPWLKLNPLTFIIEEGRKNLVFGQSVDWLGWSVLLLISLVVAWAGFWWFQKTRKGFADVL